METVKEIATESDWRKVYGGLLLASIVGLVAIAIVHAAGLLPHPENVGQLYGAFGLIAFGLAVASISSDFRTCKKILALPVADLVICLRQGIQPEWVRLSLEHHKTWRKTVAELTSEDSEFLVGEVSRSIDRWKLSKARRPKRLKRRVQMLTRILEATQGSPIWESLRPKAQLFIDQHAGA